MSVDKFGRHQSSVLKATLRGPPGIGFQLTAEGDYDMQSKRLRMLGEPMVQTDAVTVKYVNDNCLQQSVSDKATYFDARSQIIRRIKEPAHSTDAATKSYVDNRVPPLLPDGWYFYNKRIGGIADPLSNTDAVNLRFMTQNGMNKNNNIYDAQSTRISNVSDAVADEDAINLRLLKQHFESFKTDFESRVPLLEGGVWKFYDKRLSGLAAPVDDSDAVNLMSLKRYVLTMSGDGYNAHNRYIHNVKDATKDKDAVNLHLLKQAIDIVNGRIIAVLNKVKDVENQLPALVQHLLKQMNNMHGIVGNPRLADTTLTDWREYFQDEALASGHVQSGSVTV